MKRKRKTQLPRVTVMAFDRSALLAFCESVEALRHIAAELRAVADQLSTAAAARQRKTKRATPATEGISLSPEKETVQ